VAVQSNDSNAAEKKVYNVPNILPVPSLVVVVKERDGDRNTVRGVKFNYWIDNSEEPSSSRTDEKGTFEVIPRPKEKVKLSE